MGLAWQQRLRRGARRLHTLIHSRIADFEAGPGAIVMPGAVMGGDHGGALSLGAGTVIHRGAMLLPYGGFIRLGKRCRVNPYCVLYGHGGLFIGDNVRIAAHTAIIPANHGMALDGGPMADQPLSRRGIRIGDDVWIGAGARILDGAQIEDGCVVGAGAVVRGRLAANGIYAGVPARLVRMREATMTDFRQWQDNDDKRDLQKAVASP
ncbi:MAG TPA: acyltransferase [Rhizomicrobium sp.]|nr:acyltransferase [Rhizomicrobium sp.]